MTSTMSVEYARYLESYVWWVTRQWKLLEQIYRDGGTDAAVLFMTSRGTPKIPASYRLRCEQCGVLARVSHLHVHHETYERIFHERLSDLIVICEGCHAVRHGKEPPVWWDPWIMRKITQDDVDMYLDEGIATMSIAMETTRRAMEKIRQIRLTESRLLASFDRGDDP